MMTLDWQTPAALLAVAGALGYLVKPWRFFRKTPKPAAGGACGSGDGCGCAVPKAVIGKRPR